jgi:putative ABC transport system ATP-binding protein
MGAAAPNPPASTAAPGPIISAQSLRKVYGSGKLRVEALREVSFDVDRGEFIAIVGPSGSGKSTLFYILGGLTSATAGSLFIEGRDFSKLNDAERTRLRRSHIGFVFQRFNLLPTISARDNIKLAHEIAATGRAFDEAMLSHLCQLLKIQGRVEHRPSELSGGEQQRVAIARALITRPTILLADEPTGNLDSQNSEAVLSMLHASSREMRQTVMMITHNPEAAQIADRILHMRDGQIVKIEPGRGGRA